MQLDRIAEIAADYFKNKRSHVYKDIGNKYYHGIRTAELALDLRRRLFPDDASHDDVIRVASWFHDCQNGSDEHCEAGARYCEGALRGLCTESELRAICAIVRVHDDRSHRVTYDVPTMLVQDADLLDHFGSYDVIMATLQCNYEDKPVAEVVRWLYDRRKAVPQYSRELNFEISREIFLEKIEFMTMFADRMKSEGM